MSKFEVALYMFVSCALVAVCHGEAGVLYELGFIFAGILLGAVAWVLLNEEWADE